MLDYVALLTFTFLFCIITALVILYTNNREDPQNVKIRRLGRKFKVVTGPQFIELNLSKEQKKELQELVENTGADVHKFIANSNHFYFVIKHVLGKNPEPYIFCSIKRKGFITSEMTHNASIKTDFLEVPLEFNQLYRFLSSL